MPTSDLTREEIIRLKALKKRFDEEELDLLSHIDISLSLDENIEVILDQFPGFRSPNLRVELERLMDFYKELVEDYIESPSNELKDAILDAVARTLDWPLDFQNQFKQFLKEKGLVVDEVIKTIAIRGVSTVAPNDINREDLATKTDDELLKMYDAMQFFERRKDIFLELSLRGIILTEAELLDLPRHPVTNVRMRPIVMFLGNPVPREMKIFKSGEEFFRCETTATGKISCKSIRPERIKKLQQDFGIIPGAKPPKPVSAPAAAAFVGLGVTAAPADIKRCICGKPFSEEEIKLNEKAQKLQDDLNLLANVPLAMPADFFVICDRCRDARYKWTIESWINSYQNLLK